MKTDLSTKLVNILGVASIISVSVASISHFYLYEKNKTLMACEKALSIAAGKSLYLKRDQVEDLIKFCDVNYKSQKERCYIFDCQMFSVGLYGVRDGKTNKIGVIKRKYLEEYISDSERLKI